MKKQTGIWIDSTKAIIITLSDGEQKITEIQADIENRIHHNNEGDKGSFIRNQHISNEKKFEERKKHQVNTFLKNVLEQVKQDDEFYVFGPGEIKLKLKTLIENTNHLSSKLKSIETSDSMTPNQLVAHVKKFYNNKIKHHAN